MPHLYEALAWTIDEPGPPRSYVIHHNGEVLANGARVPVQRQGQASMPYADPHAQYDESRVVIGVTAPTGEPYFYVDRTNVPARPQPAYVVAPNGGLIGSIAVQVGGLKGVFSLMSGKSGSRFTLLDAHGAQLAVLAEPGLRNPKADGVVTDSSGIEIARSTSEHSPYDDRRRRRTMRVHRPLPEPLRTLLLASLIGVELMIVNG